jgi:5-methylcytosine-specific restriction endonuclease McrA
MHREWIASNREHANGYARARQRRRYTENREQILKKKRNYERRRREQDPFRAKEQRLAKRSRILGLEVKTITDHDLRRLYLSSCTICDSTDKIEIDHIIPVSKGGRHAIGNLWPLCQSCNQSKSSHLLIKWKQRPSFINGRKAA